MAWKSLSEIRKLCPGTKILIVSQNSSSEIVQGALGMGAHGYLIKSDAANLALLWMRFCRTDNL
jgi:DNA-binding NarL/FixJ family response regulator